ncbi:CBO0543 family protein [Ammoniphilus sp. YIM 78166]|uniref:CBO0543 family protein n=1 Tax=Ammoniphilus sp. YIM 78166 TaxID=1644106 RepID=UPI00106F23A0|nr:CBO0543 family protein [Ammoniphilus sp. YIM 78166]
MEWVIQWLFLLLSLGVFLYWIKHPPFRDWALVFFSTGYFSIFIAVIFVEEKSFAFPVRFLPEYFSTNVLYEFVFFPIICVLYNYTTFGSTIERAMGQAVLYSLLLTAAEFWFLKRTELIVYHRWNLMHTFISIIIFLIFTRYVLKWLGEPDPKKMRS